MPLEGKSLNVNIMGREFRIACPDDERQQLLDAVAHLNGKMREVQNTGKVLGNERIAIMAALNMAHELLTARTSGFDTSGFKRRIDSMQMTLDQVISQQDQAR